MTTATLPRTTVLGAAHVLRVENGEYVLLERTPGGLQPIGRFSNPGAAMDLLDRLELA